MTVLEELREKFENMTDSVERYKEIKKHLPMLKVSAVGRSVVSNIWGITGNRYRWRVQLSNGNKHIRFTYYDSVYNYEHEQQKLNRMDALCSYVLDAQCYENSTRFEDFASNFGFDMDDKESQEQAKKTYNGCKLAYNNLVDLFDNDELELLRIATQDY